MMPAMADPLAGYYRRQARLRDKRAQLRARKQRERVEEDAVERRERGRQRLRKLLEHYRAKQGLPTGNWIDVIAEWLGGLPSDTGSVGKNGEPSAPPGR